MDAFLEGVSKVIIAPFALFSPEYAEKRDEITHWSHRQSHTEE